MYIDKTYKKAMQFTIGTVGELLVVLEQFPKLAKVYGIDAGSNYDLAICDGPTTLATIVFDPPIK